MTAIGISVEWLITFIEVALCHYVMQIFFTNQYARKKQHFVYLCVASVITTGVILLNLVNLSFSISTVLYFILVNAIGGCVLYKGRFADFLVIAITYCAFFNFFEWSILTVTSLIVSPELFLKIQAEFSFPRIVMIICAKTVEILICLVLGKYLKIMTAKMKKTRLLLFGVIAAFISSLYLFQPSGILSDLRLNFLQTFLMIVIIFLLCFVYLFYRFKQIQNEQLFTSQQNHLLQKNYEIAQAAYQANAELYHDMRNHFLTLQSFLAENKIEEAQNYLEKLSGSKALQSVEHWTGIEAIDYILGQKISNAKQNHITVTVNAEYPKDCKIVHVDLCTILTNLFDNAIEACQKCPKETERNIEVNIRRIHQFIIIRVSNTISVKPNMQNGSLLTSKSDCLHHGWGLRSVKSAVEKYQGTMEYDYADNRFTVSIMLFYR